jgi:hypothetical protein
MNLMSLAALSKELRGGVAQCVSVILSRGYVNFNAFNSTSPPMTVLYLNGNIRSVRRIRAETVLLANYSSISPATTMNSTNLPSKATKNLLTQL